MTNLTKASSTSYLKPEIKALTGIRGVAAWVVVLYHFRDELPSLPMGWIVNNGEYCVDLFFVMSGLVISLSYRAMFTSSVTPINYIKFIGYRIARIYPAHLTVLLIYTSLPALYMLTHRPIPENRFSIIYFFLSIFLIQNWGFTSTIEWNIPAWSISTELLFYLIFPFLSFFSGRGWSKLGIFISLIILFISILGLGLVAGHLTSNISKFGAARCVLECTLGFVLVQVVQKFPMNLFQSYILSLFGFFMIVLLYLQVVREYLALPIAISCLLMAIMHEDNIVSRVLSHRLLLFVGRISYSTYIVHYIVKDLIKVSIQGLCPQWFLLAVFIVVTLGASKILHQWIEEGGQRLGRRLVNSAVTRLT